MLKEKRQCLQNLRTFLVLILVPIRTPSQRYPLLASSFLNSSSSFLFSSCSIFFPNVPQQTRSTVCNPAIILTFKCHWIRNLLPIGDSDIAANHREDSWPHWVARFPLQRSSDVFKTLVIISQPLAGVRVLNRHPLHYSHQAKKIGYNVQLVHFKTDWEVILHSFDCSNFANDWLLIRSNHSRLLLLVEDDDNRKFYKKRYRSWDNFR